MLLTPIRIRTLQRKLYCKAKQEKSASLTMKNIGKPCTGEPYARFDEGALGRKDTEIPGTLAEPVLYSTRNSFL